MNGINDINDRLLIINDVTGYGRVSSMAMVPIMTAYGMHPYVLPTALVSNTMDYGSSAILDTTQFMRDSICKWKELGFNFNIITTGLINSAEQLDIIENFLTDQEPKFVMVDPIMADDGEMYPGMYGGAIDCYRKLAKHADLIIPNFTEATFLTDMFVGRRDLTMDEHVDLMNAIRKLGVKDVVISGCTNDEGMNFNLVYDHIKDETIAIPFDKIPLKLVGTGDVFSAALLSEIHSGYNLYVAVDNAAQFVRYVVIENKNNIDNYDIHIEKTIQEAINEIRQR